MRLSCITAVALGLILSSSAYAHLCNNIYRTPDRIVIKPEKDVVTMEKDDEFRVFIKNNYAAKLDKVRLSIEAEGGGLQVAVTPEMIQHMKPGEKGSFTVRITADPHAGRGKHKLIYSMSAAQVGFEAVGDAPLQDLYKALADGNPSPGIMAAETLVRRGDPKGREAFEVYVTGQRGGNEYACRALRALGRAGDASLAPLAVGCLDHQNGQIKGNALLGVGQLEVGQDVLAKVQQLRQSRDNFVSICAQAALAMHGDKPVLQTLKGVLNDADPFVRVAAAWPLAMGGDQQAIDVLDACLSHQDANVIYMAGDALVSAAERQDGIEGWTGTEIDPLDVASVVPLGTTSAGPPASDDTWYATTDKLSYKIDAPVSAGGEVGVLLYHSYPTALHNVTLTPDSSVAELRQPATLERLKPTTMETVRLALALKGETSADWVMVPVTISADELDQDATIKVPVAVTAQGAAAVNKELSIPIGATTVRVLPFSNLIIYFCVAAVVAGIGIVIWRTRKANRPNCDGGNCAVKPVIG